MSTLPEPPPVETLDSIPGPLYRMPLEKYEEMVAAGVFNKHDRFHLIAGLLVDKMTKNPPHSAAREAVRRAIESHLPLAFHVRGDHPLWIPSQSSMPEPDLIVARGTWRDYATRHPEPADVALVVEVADSSLALDRKLGQIHSAAGLPVYWILNLVDRQPEAYSEPSAAGFASRRDFEEGDSAPLELDAREAGRIVVAEMLS